MLSRAEIDRRLTEKVPGTERRVATGREREALETAQKLGEWVANADHGQDAVELLKARAWLRGEGEDAS